MKILLWLGCCWATVFCLQAQILPFGSEWKYSDSGIEPSAQLGIVWFQPSFDDALWASGNAQLGYGDGDESQEVSSDATTAYFRKTVNVQDPSIYDHIILNLVYDDGAVVYLNGSEVWRKNMPEGPISYDTFAASNSGDNATSSISLSNLLLTGNNTLAVEVHQRNAGSSDLSFDLSMVGYIPSGDYFIEKDLTWYYYDNGDGPASQNMDDWETPGFDESSWKNGFAQLGYGDGDEATTINPAVLTAYFKKRFNVTGTTEISQLELNLTYDDGAVVYLNGTEVWRVNMPDGDIVYETFSSTSSSDNAIAIQFIASTLVEGENVIAIEVHQRSESSSDISFDFSIREAILEIVRGPYLQKAFHDRMTIRWRTSKPAATFLEYGDATNNLTMQVSDATLKTEHEVTITGLTSDTKYFYRIGDGNVVLASESNDLYFKTYPLGGVDAPLTAWILGDCGTGNDNQRAVREAYYNYIGQDHTDMMLFLGDNAYNDGTDDEYQGAIFKDMYEAKLQNTVAWSCLGNHDGHSADSDSQTGPYYDIFSFPTAAECGGTASGTEAYYSFDYGNVHFIILDSYETDRTVGGPMYQWCLNDIQSTTAKWIIAFWHHPPYSKGSHNSDTESNLVQMRERFLPILENNGVDMILSGHSHSYERSYYINGHYGVSGTFDSNLHTIGENGAGNGRIAGNGAYKRAAAGPDEGEGTVYITTGSAGKTSGGTLNHPAMFHSVSTLGSCVLEINEDTLNVKFITNQDVVDDYFTIVKCKSLNLVTNTLDDGTGSLREKIQNACPYDTITFEGNIIDPIVFQSEIILDKKLWIKGLDSYTTLSGNNSSRIFSITTEADVELINIRLSDAFAPVQGGAINNLGNLIFNDVLLENNKEGNVPKALSNQGQIFVKENSTTIIKH